MTTSLFHRPEQDRRNGPKTDFCGPSRNFACSPRWNKGVFARPNLKLFLLGAILILVVQALVSNGRSESTEASRIRFAAASGRQVDINQLLAAARKRPSYELFTLVSQHYERIGDLRRAIRYLRMADEAESDADL